ncbi:MAG: RHS repeat protein [Fuerstiella sp.]|nr:RHS repeat protein [Fuerstiella sp.]
MAEHSTVAELVITRGTLTGDGDVTVTDTLNWSSGYMLGAGRTVLASGSSGTISGGGNKYLGRTLQNAGTIDYSGTTLILGPEEGSTGVIDNLATAQFSVTGDGGLGTTYGGTFNNAGTFTKTGDGTTTKFIGVPFNNTGTANVQSGSLQLSGGGTSSGRFDANATTTLGFGGTYNLDAASDIVSAATVQFTLGTTTVNGGYAAKRIEIYGAEVTFNTGFSVAALEMVRGVLDVDGDVTVADTLSWSGGTMIGAGKTVLASGGRGTISGGWNKYLGRTLQNAGTIDYSASAFYFGPISGETGNFDNLSTGQFNVTGAGDLRNYTVGAHAFNNVGTFTKSGDGTTTKVVGVAFNSTGTVQVPAGTLDLNGSITFDGDHHFASHHRGTIVIDGDLLGSTQNVDLFSPQGTTRLNGVGSSTSPDLLEVMAQDLGSVPAGYFDNYAYGRLVLADSSYVQLVDAADNATGADTEALYANELIMAAGTTLDLNGHNVYVRAAQLDGTVVGGSVQVLPDGGPVPLNRIMSGNIETTAQTDEWTFLARAGQSVTVLVDTGIGSQPQPLQPNLNYAEVRLFDAENSLVATGSNAAKGDAASLLGIQLPTAGTHRLEVSSQPGSTGNYSLSVWDATVDDHPMVFGDRNIGQIETAYSVDLWTFSALENQQIQFDWINTSNPEIRFGLTGPNGWIGFDGLGADSSLVTLPYSGTYVLEAYSTGFRGGSYAFSIEETSLTELTLGSAHMGTFVNSGQAQLFHVAMPDKSNRIVSLDDTSDANRNELYVKLGSPPTRSDYDYRFGTMASADQEILAPLVPAGDWHILVYNEAVTEPSDYSLVVTNNDFVIRDVAPDFHGDSEDVVMTLTGIGFSNNSIVELIAGDGTVYAGTPGEIATSNRITATFAAGTVPPGVYSVRTTNPGTDPILMIDAFEMIDGGEARLETNLVLPAFVGFHSLATLYIEYSNTGTVAMPAAVLVLTSSPPSILTLDKSKVVRGFYTYGQPDGFSDTLQFLGSGVAPGILNPGESLRVPVYYAGQLEPRMGSSVTFELGLVTTGNDAFTLWNNEPTKDFSLRLNYIDSQLDDSLSDNIGAISRARVSANLWHQFGGREEILKVLVSVGRREIEVDKSLRVLNSGDYAATLAENASYLAELGLNIVDAGSLWGFEVQQANGLNPISELGTVTDAYVPAPGLPLTFSRSYDLSLFGKYKGGKYKEDSLGHGWTHNWDSSLTVEDDGTVVINGPGVAQRRFQPDIRGGYLSAAGDLASLVEVDGGFVLREFNGLRTRFQNDGKLTSVEDTNGNRITADYTEDLLTSLTHSSGQFLHIAYDTGGFIERVTDSHGRETLYQLQEELFQYVHGHSPVTFVHRLVAVVDSDGHKTKYVYALDGPLISIERAGEVNEHFSYDERDRLTGIASERDSTTGELIDAVTFSYNSTGKVIATDPTGFKTEFFYDHRGQLAAQRDDFGNFVQVTYDDNGTPIATTDATGQTSLLKYDNAGNLILSTDPLGNITRFAYTTEPNRLSRLEDANKNSMNFNHDEFGNVVSIVRADNTSQTYSHDALGNLTLATNRRNDPIAFVYDSSGRVTLTTYPDGSTEQFEYDPGNGNLVAVTDSSGTTSLQYNSPQSESSLTEITYPTGRVLQYAYDSAGRRTQMVDADGNTVNYFFDARGQLERLEDGTGATIVSYAFDAAGRLERQDAGNGTYTTYQYDDAQLSHLVNYASDGSVNSRFDYTYDLLGRRAASDTIEGVWTYEYDAIDQLTHAVFDSNDPAAIPDQDLAYVYDAVGNRIHTLENGVATDYAPNEMNQYDTVGTAVYAYDADGNLARTTDDGKATTFTYDARNRLVGVTSTDGTWVYEYDAFGNRIASKHNGERTEYLIDPFGLGNVVAEYDDAGTPNHRYTHGLGLVNSIDTAGQQYFYDYDAIGSTVGLSDVTGQYVNQYSTLPFGGDLSSIEAIDNPFQFVGQWGVMHEDNGLEFMRARFYDTDSGRFVSEDPIGLKGGQVNLYGYVGNNSTSLIDASGLIPLSDDDLKNGETAAYIGCYISQDILDVPACWENPDFAPWGDEPPSAAATQWPPLVFAPDVLEMLEAPFDPFQIDPCRNGCFAPDLKKSPISNGSSGTVASNDPNQKIGPGGFGDAGYVQPDSLFAYRVDFENDAKATAPAQRVDITDQLSTDLDWATLEFTSVGFGDTVIPVPAGSQYFRTTVDLNANDMDFEVDVELNFHSETGLIDVAFQSIDPATSLPPDVLTGFLPPEDETGRGQGYFSYIIDAKADLVTGTEIRNIAIIVFDRGEVIATNQIDPHDPSQGTDPAKEALNTIDADTPDSNVLPLASLTAGNQILVEWTGDDGDGSGVTAWNIYVADNDAPFQLWLAATPDSTARYDGVTGHKYQFYSVAIDGVGHTEEAATTFDAETTVVDASFTVTETDGNTVVTESGSTDTFAVVLDGPPLDDVVLNVSSADSSEASVTPATLVFTSTNWDIAQTVTVTEIIDGVVDGDQTTNIVVSVDAASSHNAFDESPDQTVTVTTSDIDGIARNPGNIDGDEDFDANDSFLIHLMKLSGTDAQIDQSKGSSPLSAAEIREACNQLGSTGDVDGDQDFDANDSFLIHLVMLSGTDAQIGQSKGSSSLSAAEIRANVNALGGGAATQSVAVSSQVLQPVVAGVPKSNDARFIPTPQLNSLSPSPDSPERFLFPNVGSDEQLESTVLLDAWQPESASEFEGAEFRRWIDAI